MPNTRTTRDYADLGPGELALEQDILREEVAGTVAVIRRTATPAALVRRVAAWFATSETGRSLLLLAATSLAAAVVRRLTADERGGR